MEKRKLDPKKLTPEDRDRLELWKNNRDKLQVLQDIAMMVQEVIGVMDDQSKSGGKTTKEVGALLVDMRESLKAIEGKKDPDASSYSKPIVEAVEAARKALVKSFEGIEVSPVINNEAPKVSNTIDLKGVEKILKTEMPKAFQEAIKLIPSVEIPDTDYSPIIETMQEISEQLVSLETATRIKPQQKEYATNSSNQLNVNAVNVVETTGAHYAKIIDPDTTANTTYIGHAAIGSATSSAVWQVRKFVLSGGAQTVTWADGNDSFDNIWDNRASLSYS